LCCIIEDFLPSITPSIRQLMLLFIRIISDASFATSTASLTDIATSASCSAGTSFTPSPYNQHHVHSFLMP